MDFKAEIIEKLTMLDEEVWLTLGDDNIYYELTLVGGSALVLIDKLSRATIDIDTIMYSNELKPFLEKYDVNDYVRAYLNNFPDDYLSRRILIDLPTRKIKCYAVSLEDIVISKLSSQRPKDYFDIRNPDLVKSLDWDILDKIVNSDDFKDNMLNEHDYNMFMYNYRDYKEEVLK